MEGIRLKHLMFAFEGRFSRRGHLSYGLSERKVGVSFNKKVNGQILQSTFITFAKDFAFQDFQGFAKPLRLLPATEANICTGSSLEETSELFGDNGRFTLYIVQLKTSSEFGSSLRDSNAAILLCLTDVQGDSILHRIPIIKLGQHVHSKELSDSDEVRFQTGSVEKIVVKGPKLAGIEALWIGLESGSWRLEGVSLTVISQNPSSRSSDYKEEKKYNSQHYKFQASDVLLGEGDGVSMVELRPSPPTHMDQVDFLTLFNMGLSQSTSPASIKISNEESMKEYAELKVSLLLYDAMLIFIGTPVAALSTDEKAAYAFLFGGVCGFLYLLLLQKSVDGLPTPELSDISSKRENLIQVFGGFKGPLSSVALALILTVIVGKYGLGGSSVVLTPQELLVGVGGFLTCKVAVVLAALKSMQTDQKKNL